ncbi:hypothetical protein EB008_04275 [bacterium]|nr:hypothetical protein [bacterium]
MSSIPPIGPSRVPASDRESNGSNLSTSQKIRGIFEKVRSFFQITQSEQDQVSRDDNTRLIIQYLYKKAKLDEE